MKKILATLAATAALTVGAAAPAMANIDWKPGTTAASGYNTSHDWQAGYTYRWWSGRTPHGAYVTQLAKMTLRLSWIGPGDAQCDTIWQDRLVQGARFKTTLHEASLAHNWYLGTRRLGCPTDGHIALTKTWTHANSEVMYYMRTGAAPYINTHITMIVDDWNDPEWGHTNHMFYRGRQMPLPW